MSEQDTVAVLYRRTLLPVNTDLNGPKLVLTRAVVNAVSRLLPRNVSGEDHENVLYIAGAMAGPRHIGVMVILPNAETGRGHYRTSRASHAAVLDVIGDAGLSVVAQVHCHPGSLVYHSDADDDLAFIRAEGYWSVVVPHYGRRGMKPFTQCGFHLYERGRFSVLSQDAVSARVCLLPDAHDLTKRNEQST